MEEIAGLESVSALVLAGGEGKRLQSVVGQRAKVLAQVGGKPFLSHLLSRLRLQGIRRVILALGCFHQDVLDYLESQSLEGLEIVPVIEDGPLGTAGAIRHADSALTCDPVIVLNGDTYAEVSLETLLDFHRERFAAVTLVAAYKKAAQRYGSIEIGEDGRVLGFIEKGKGESGYVNAGVYVVSRQVIQRIPADRAVSWEREVLPTLVGEGLFACCGSFRFIDIGTPASYRRAAQFLERQ